MLLQRAVLAGRGPRPTLDRAARATRPCAAPRRVVTRMAYSVGKFFVCGNWACNGTTDSVEKLVESLNRVQIDSSVEAVLAPPFPFVVKVRDELHEKSPFELAAQNICIGRGSFTGEVSAEILLDLGVEYVLCGHSDRRILYWESNENVSKKVAHALSKGLKVIACVGENVDQHYRGQTADVMDAQLNTIAKVVKGDWDRVVLAYEPVWAIGTKATCTPEQAGEMFAFIRAWVAKKVSKDVAASVRIIYGGNINSKNCLSFVNLDSIDGFLVGGASLIPLGFAQICNSVQARPGHVPSYYPATQSPKRRAPSSSSQRSAPPSADKSLFGQLVELLSPAPPTGGAAAAGWAVPSAATALAVARTFIPLALPLLLVPYGLGAIGTLATVGRVGYAAAQLQAVSPLAMPLAFTPLQAAMGGAVLGLSAIARLALTGRLPSSTGALRSALFFRNAPGVALLGGLFAGGLVLSALAPGTLEVLPATFSAKRAAVGGLLVGFGTAMARCDLGGCDMGSLLSGLARGAPRAITAAVVAGVAGAVAAVGTGTGFALGLPAVPAVLSLPPLMGRVMAGGLEVISMGTVAFCALGVLAAMAPAKLSTDDAGASAGPLELGAEAAVGFFFALGLGLAGFTRYSKVAAMLSIGATYWDASVALAMAAAVTVAGLGFRAFLTLRSAPLLAGEFALAPAKKAVDGTLVWGALVFGLGWGLCGVGLETAVVALARPSKAVLVFVASAVLGMAFQVRLFQPTAGAN